MWFIANAALVALVLTAAWYIPPSLAWENGPLENLQALLLFAGVAVFAGEALRARAKERRLALAAAGVFWLLLGRELSWGRVFFPLSAPGEKPFFIGMEDLPWHAEIHALIALYMVCLVIALVKYVPWRRALALLSKKTAATLVLMVALAYLGEHTRLFGAAGENLEEVAELVAYSLFLYESRRVVRLLSTPARQEEERS